MTKEKKRIPEWYRVEPYFGDESADIQADDDVTKVELKNPNCATYTHERSRKDWKRIRDSYFSYEPRCGHAIDYLVRNTDSKVSIGVGKERAGQLARFIQFLGGLDKCICDAELVDVDEFLSQLCWMDVTESTVSSYRSALCNVYKHIELYREEESLTSRAHILDSITPENYNTGEGFDRFSLSIEELKKLLDAVSIFRNLLMIRVLVETGPRVGALVLLLVSDVDLENQKLRTNNTKTGGSYTAYIPPELAMLLRRWIDIERPAIVGNDSNRYLFPNRDGGHLEGQRVRDIVQEAAEEAGIQRETGRIPLSERQKEMMGTEKDYRKSKYVDVHTLRHTYNALLAKTGVSREARSSALDHSSTEVTKEHYEHDEDRHWREIKEKFSGLPDFLD